MQPTTLPLPLDPLPHLAQPPNLLPFHIDYTGPAPVSTYLLTRPSPASSSASSQLSSFRGRQLVSQPLNFPPSYTGVVLNIPLPPLPSSSHSKAGFANLSDPRSNPSLSPQPKKSSGSRISSRQRTPTTRYGAPVDIHTLRAPPTKKQKVVVTKKFKLESDSEDEEEPKVASPGEENEKNTATTDLAATSSMASTITSTSNIGTVTDGKVLEHEEVLEDYKEPTPELALPTNFKTALHTHSPPSIFMIAPSCPPPSDFPEEEDEDASLYLTNAELSGPLPRELIPSHTFDSITLWTVDDPVDQGRDEFFRSFDVGGWCDLAAVIHRED